MITAPYNFVPLSDKVVMPFWAKHVSHDIPFEDAQSGILKIKIKAESPIYVRNGVSRKVDEKDSKRNEFNNINGGYFIPGSSLKGMIRSVMEIMSYGRMKNKVNDHKYSVRDFQNDNIYNKTEISIKAECGWLYKKGDTFYLDECGQPGRIPHKNLDRLCQGQKISEYYKRAENISKDKDKSAKSKYGLFGFEKSGHKFTKDREDMGRIIYRIDDQGGRKGTIVLTGQPGVRKEPKEGKASGKHLEFIFFESNHKGLEVPEDVIKNFYFAYYDHDKNQQKDDWKWRKKQLVAGEKIPVFYRKNSKGEIIDMGLTQLFKITYNNSVIDLINTEQKDSDGYDLAETIFGFTEDKKALKGRVHFGHAFVEGQANPIKEVNQVLAGPKASYYPNYIEQDPDNEGKLKRNYKTFMDGSAKIRGWKRYPIVGEIVKSYELPKRGDGTINYDVATNFVPLPTDTTFTCDISYHNLRKEELGALISALTFHNTKGLYHSIGSAKPLGYGKILLEIEGLDENTSLEMLKAFELFMDSELGNSTPLWFQSEQIKELTAMAKPGNDELLSYMKMKKRKSEDEPMDFISAKQRKLALLKYSLISNNNVDVIGLTSPEELQKAKISYQNEKSVLENQEDLFVIQERVLEAKGKELMSAIEEKKKQFFKKLEEEKAKLTIEGENRKLQQKADEREAKRSEEAKRVMKEGLLIESDLTQRRAFDNVSKEIMNYVKKLHKKTNEKWLQQNIKDGKVVLESDHDSIKKALKVIYKNLPNQIEVKKWQQPFESNPIFKKIAWWLGHENAQSLYNELTK